MVPPESVLLQGGGGHARVVIDALRSISVDVAGIFDPRLKGVYASIPLLGDYNADYLPVAKVIVAIGDNVVRMNVAALTKHKFTKVIHSSVILAPDVLVGAGSMVLHGAIVQTGSSIGQHVIVNTGVSIDHDCVIEDYVHIAPGAVLCGAVKIGRGTLVGARAVVIPGKKIGKGCTIGAGTVVLHDIPDFSIAVGNPARIIKTCVAPW